MMNDHYVLDGHVAKAVSLMEWTEWFEKEPFRHVADETIGEARISTVFLSLDHQWGQGPPLIFETMVFGGPLDQEQERYTTWDEAEAGHKTMVEKVKNYKEV
jgi:hypothetical protein